MGGGGGGHDCVIFNNHRVTSAETDGTDRWLLRLTQTDCLPRLLEIYFAQREPPPPPRHGSGIDSGSNEPPPSRL